MTVVRAKVEQVIPRKHRKMSSTVHDKVNHSEAEAKRAAQWSRGLSRSPLSLSLSSLSLSLSLPRPPNTLRPLSASLLYLLRELSQLRLGLGHSSKQPVAVYPSLGALPAVFCVCTLFRVQAVLRFYDAVMRALVLHVDFSIVKCCLIASPGFVADDFFKYIMDQAACAR